MIGVIFRPVNALILSMAKMLSGSLIATSADARLLIPTAANDPATWRALDFNDSAWSTGPTGIGYETNNGYQQLIATDVEADMFSQNSSVFIRLPFDLPDPASLSSLTLRMKYDDAFVAFINGTEIARSANAPATLAWNSRASASRNDSAAIVLLRQRIDFDDAFALTSYSKYPVEAGIFAFNDLVVTIHQWIGRLELAIQFHCEWN